LQIKNVGGGKELGLVGVAIAPYHSSGKFLETAHLLDISSVIVFTRTKHGADRLARQLSRRGHSVAALHGNRTQGQRERALSDLRRGRVQCLVATDIASRGIDVKDISHIVNFDVPHTPEDYVHRIGRTGRVDATGDAFTLMSPEEQKDTLAIERFLGRTIPRVLLPDFDYHKRATPEPRGAHDERPRRSEPARMVVARTPPAGIEHGRRPRIVGANDRRRRRM